MLKKFGVILLAVLFIGSMTCAPIIGTVDAAAKCDCGKDCKCANCTTDKGDCNCKNGKNGNGCQCGKDCKCGKCSKGNCDCKAGDKGCNCMSDGKGCKCGKDCKCEHCKTGKGKCNCKSDGKGGCNCGKDCKCKHCSASAMVKPTSDAAYAKTMVSKAGTFKVTYTSDLQTVPVNKLQSWKLKVETADGKPVKDAKITVSGTMPEHGHGMPTQPKVTKNYGDGTYLVEGMKFSMSGWWVVNVSVNAGGKTDNTSFNLMLK
ncbi:MAG: FixH family protein [Dissulfurispiraceae bacterium]